MTQKDIDRLQGCDPRVIQKIDKVQQALLILGYPTCVPPDGGFRTTERQQQLYAEGRDVPGPDATPANPMGRVVTDADGVHVLSNHQSGRACDLVFLDEHGNPSWDDKRFPFPLIGWAGKSQGMAWGGDWSGKLHDIDHLEIPKGA